MAAHPPESKPDDPTSATTPVAQESVPAAGGTKDAAPNPAAPDKAAKRPREIGGPTGPEPTRYGDWERNGRVSDF